MRLLRSPNRRHNQTLINRLLRSRNVLTAGPPNPCIRSLRDNLRVILSISRRVDINITKRRRHETFRNLTRHTRIITRSNNHLMILFLQQHPRTILGILRRTINADTRGKRRITNRLPIILLKSPPSAQNTTLTSMSRRTQSTRLHQTARGTITTHACQRSPGSLISDLASHPHLNVKTRMFSPLTLIATRSRRPQVLLIRHSHRMKV